MAVIYLSSVDGLDSDNGSTWALAKATLAAALTAAGAGGTVYVDGAHAETKVTAMTLTSPGTSVSPVQVLCVSRAGNPQPPTTLATTATVTTTGDVAMSFAGQAYVYGIAFQCGSGGSGGARINFVSASLWWWRFEACKLLSLNAAATLNATAICVGIAGTTNDDNLLELINTSVSFNVSAQSSISVLGCRFVWRDTPAAVASIATSAALFTPISLGTPATIRLSGLDLSGLAGAYLASNTLSAYEFILENCRISQASLYTGLPANRGGSVLTAFNCDSGNTNYRYYKLVCQGEVRDEEIVARTGGASDGTTTVSRKMSSMDTVFFSPLESDWSSFWNDSLSALTISVAVVTAGVTLTDADAWVEVEYLGTAGFPQSVTATDRAASILATPANQTTDSTSVWTTTGLTSPIKQTLSVSVTPVIKGLVRARVVFAKAQSVLYYDPKPDIS